MKLHPTLAHLVLPLPQGNTQAKPKEPIFHRKKKILRHTLAFTSSTFESEPKIFKTMNSKIINLQTFSSYLNSPKRSLAGVFSQRDNSYIDEFNLFITYFNAIPNFIHEINIDCRKANKWFTETYKSEIKDWHYNKRYIDKQSKKAEFDDIFYILLDDLIVYFDTNYSTVRFLFRKTDTLKIEAIINGIKKSKERKEKHIPKILLLANSRSGIETKSLEISKPKLNIEDNYNDDFSEIHHTILKRLSQKNDKGLVLLHGKPGTGKTSYIRYLVSSLKKNVIFLPPNMASAITNPDLISILIDNSNSIFVIEDAENIVADREKDGHSPVSALLNISDGLLSDCLNIQIICSFNTDISKVDSALMRKGRLIAKYEFKELEVEKANALSKKLGFNSTFNSSMALTAIYNQDEKDFDQSKTNKTVGFKTSQFGN